MILSKSFGYALRGVLYIAAIQGKNQHIQIQQIAEELDVPRHFLAKVMKRLVKSGILDSTKGHAGGYVINDKTLSTSIMNLLTLIEGEEIFKMCMIGFKKCNEQDPCPLHHQVVATKNQMIHIFSETKIGDLLIEDKAAFIKSLVSA